MRRLAAHLALAALAFALAPAPAAAEDAPPPARRKIIEPRKQVDATGKLVDPYWGLTYTLPGLAEKKTGLATGKFLDASAGRVQVDIGIFEYADELTAKERRDADLKKWEDKKREMREPSQGDDPAPWIVFQETSPTGSLRRHGYAWYARGCRLFLVHAHVSAETEGGAEAVKAALGGLSVGPETGAAVLAFAASRERQMPPDDPGVLLQAAQQYLNEHPDKASARPKIALGLLTQAVENLDGSPLARNPGAVTDLYTQLAIAQMKLEKYDDAVATFGKAMEFAEKTERRGPNQAMVQYNLACALSLAGRIEEAFAALDKAFPDAQWAPTTMKHAHEDEDLKNLRASPRWKEFWQAHPHAK